MILALAVALLAGVQVFALLPHLVSRREARRHRQRAKDLLALAEGQRANGDEEARVTALLANAHATLATATLKTGTHFKEEDFEEEE